MKQYIHHPDRDEVLEFDVPDGAVYFAIGGNCPACKRGDRSIVGIDHEAGSYECGTRQFMPLDKHKTVPPVQWSATIPATGPARGCVVEVATKKAHAIQPRVISGDEYARMRSA